MVLLVRVNPSFPTTFPIHRLPIFEMGYELGNLLVLEVNMFYLCVRPRLYDSCMAKSS